jgi:hypothetical protein
VNAIVGSLKPERSQSSEKQLKSTLVLAALQQALRREATTSRRNSTSSQMAQSSDARQRDRLRRESSSRVSRSWLPLERRLTVVTLGACYLCRSAIVHASAGALLPATSGAETAARRKPPSALTGPPGR